MSFIRRRLIRVTDRAEADLAETCASVALEGAEASATRLIETIETAAEGLLDFPPSRTVPRATFSWMTSQIPGSIRDI